MNYTLKLGKCGLQFKIALTKSYDDKTGFTQTYPDPEDPSIYRCVRTIKVLTKDSVRPADVKDIRMVVPWTEVKTSFTYMGEDGTEKLLPLDHEVIGKIYAASENMTSMGFIDRSEVAPCDYDGSHYFITVQKDSKAKTPDANDIKAYSTVYYICKNLKQCLLVNFVSGDREKAAVIYAHKDGLMLSILLHTNYQRKAPEVSQPELPSNIEALANKLVSVQKLACLPEDKLTDKYEERIKQYLQAAREQMRTSSTHPHKITLKAAPKPLDNDFFSLLAGL
jgi:non-homologous end joining protein Ku